jgi:hypothetical protein
MPLVLLGVLGLLWAIVSRHRRQVGLGNLSVRGAFVVAFLLFEALVAIVTESASVGHHLTAGTLAAMWGSLLILLLGLLLGLLLPEIRQLTRRRAITAPRHATKRTLAAALSIEDKAWLAIMLGIFGVLLFIGWVYPPSNGDSMVYHLARVAHWVQDRSVSGFATHYLAQIELAPLAEYNVLQLHLLSNSDRLDGYVQLLSAVVSVVGVSEMARLLGGDRRVQMAAAVLCATIPTGILEATSTENNYFAAAIAVALLTTLLSMSLDRRWARGAVILGCALGTAAIAKGTIPAYFGPAVILLGALVVRRGLRTNDTAVALRRVIGTGAIAVVCALVLAGPFLGRNIALFGGPTGPVSQGTLSTQLTARAGAANVIRSTSANFNIGNGKNGFETDVSKVALGFFRRLYSPLRVSQSDPRYLLGTPTDAFQVRNWSPFDRSEDFGATPWQVVLLIAAGAVLGVGVIRRRRELQTPLLVAIGLGCGYILFTATARWSVFQVRYQLPVLVAWCTLIAVALGRFHRYVGRVILVALVVACLPQLLDNSERPLLHPEYTFTSYLQPYFLDGTLQDYQKAAAANYESLTQSVVQSNCSRVGLANWVLVEYPIWAGLQHEHWQGTLDDVDVYNASSTFESTSFHPCAWIREEAAGYVGPDGTVDLQYGQLALAVDARDAATIRTRVPGFASDVRGVVILPGGGWALADGHAPKLAGESSVYLYSDKKRQVQLRLQETKSSGDPTLRVQLPGRSTSVAPDSTGTLTVELGLAAGVNRLRLTAGGPGSARGGGAAIPLTAVIEPPTP